MTPVIFGCAGPALTDSERSFFAEVRPAGLILFARNCDKADQIRALTRQFCEVVDRDNPLILIDQEGGRVSRLAPPLCPEGPAAERFGVLFADNPAHGREALEVYCRILASSLLALGITVDCFPVLDVRWPGADPVIGDRAFSDDPEIVAALGRVAVDTMLGAGLLPVIKHIPGHGRATADSHSALPVVDADRDSLTEVDFKPFRALADAPLAMTAHITYPAWDNENCATFSPTIVEEVIRAKIGFQGLLMTDDIAMGALDGSMQERARRALSAGCELVLHCSGNFDEMQTVAHGARDVPPDLDERLDAAMASCSDRAKPDLAAEWDRLDRLLND